MTVIEWEAEDPGPVIARIIQEFDSGNPVVLPTDTLYGLAAPIGSNKAMERIFQLKERPKEITLPVAVGTLYQLDPLVKVRKWQKNNLRNNLPGPVTFIMEAVDGLPEQVVRDGTIAVRVPRHRLFRELIKRSGPIAMTSANLHSSDDIYRASDIDVAFGGDLLVVEDDGSIRGDPSAIVDITEKDPVLVRKGKVNIEEWMEEDHG